MDKGGMECNASLPLCSNGQKLLSVHDDGTRVKKTGRDRLQELEETYAGLLELRVGLKFPTGWVPTEILAKALLARTSIAPMRVLPFEVLKSALARSTMGSLSHSGSTVDITEIHPAGRVLFLSHRWWSSRRAEPDRLDRGWPKARVVVERLVPMLLKRLGCDCKDVYVWWDYFCINQHDPAVRLRQLESIPIYVAMSDVVAACRAGDEHFHGMDGPEVVCTKTQAILPYTGAPRDHPGHYNNRVWTACELFMATSEFQARIRGEQMLVYSVDLDKDMESVHEPCDQTLILHSELHEMRAWSMPPRDNLVNMADLYTLEPLIVILGSQTMPRIVKAAKFGLNIGLEVFLSGSEDVNSVDPATGEAALHAAARAVNESMIRKLLALPSAQVNLRSRTGQTPLHLLVSSGVYDHRCNPEARHICVQYLLSMKADPCLPDLRGRTAIDVAIARYGFAEAANLFPEQRLDIERKPSLYSFTPSFNPSAVGGPDAKLTTGQRTFPNGNVIHWRCLSPSLAKQGHPELVVCFPTACAVASIYLEWAHRVVASTGCEVVMVDSPGGGRSKYWPGSLETPLDAEDTFSKFETTEEIMDEFCRDIEATFEAEGWAERTAHVVGTSFGCVIAVHLALKHPLWFRSVTMYGWPHSYRHTPEVEQSLKCSCKGLVGLYLEGNVTEFDKALLGYLSASTDPILKEMFLYACRPGGDNHAQNGAMNMLTFLLYAMLKNVLPLHTLSVPAMVVMGEADAMFMDHGLEFGKLVPHSRLAILPYVGHVAPVENPSDSHDIFVSFLESVMALSTLQGMPRTVGACTEELTPNQNTGNAFHIAMLSMLEFQ